MGVVSQCDLRRRRKRSDKREEVTHSGKQRPQSCINRRDYRMSPKFLLLPGARKQNEI